MGELHQPVKLTPRLSKFESYHSHQIYRDVNEKLKENNKKDYLIHGDIDELVKSLPCQGREYGFKSRYPRHFNIKDNNSKPKIKI